MESAAEIREPTTVAEKHYTVKAEEEEDEKVFDLERKTTLFRNGKGPDSTEGSSSSSTVTTTNTSSSSSFSGDGEVPKSPEQESEIEFQEELHNEGSIVYFGGAQAIDQLSGDAIEEEEELEIGDVEDEYDVEKVLANQKTHDLYCPKCKSCITRKVVLRRKRKLPHVPEDPKRRRGSELNYSPLHSEDNLASGEGGQNSDHVSFVFKCLSCFNIFKSTEPPTSEGVGMSNVQPKPEEKHTSNSSWFSSIFGFNKPVSDALIDGSEIRPSQGKNPGEREVVNDGETVEEGKTHQKIDIDDSNPADGNHPSGKGHLSPIQLAPGMTSGIGTSGTRKPEFDQYKVQSPGTDNLPIRSPGGMQREPIKPVVEGRKLEILKSIVYGGLIESMTSLGVISSAAGSGASTLNIMVLGLANLFGGLILLIHNLQELREEDPKTTTTEDNRGQEVEGRYKRLLGRRENFAVHATLAILSFIIAGLLPPVVYYFSFSKTHNRDYKVASVFGSSLLCIVLLAIAKAHVTKGSYTKSVLYYAMNAVSVSGITYVAGNLVNELLEKYGWSDGSETPAGDMMLLSLMGRKAGSFGYSSASSS